MEARTIATPPSNSLPPGYQGATTASEPNVGFLVMGSFMISWAIAACIYAHLPKAVQRPFSLKSRAKVPCHHCQYFSHNPYLKCALHPESVLTEQAVDCRDYHSGSMAEPFEK